DMAAEAYRKAIAAGGNNEEVFYALANACRRTGRTKEAEEADREFHKQHDLRVSLPLIEQKIKASPSDADARLKAARGYRSIRRDPVAIHHYEAYLRLRPDDRAVAAEASEYVRTINLESRKLLPESDTPPPP